MRRLIFVLAIVLAAGLRLKAEPISYFASNRGSQADGGNEKLPDQFDGDGSLVWKQPLDPGHSTPCLCGDLICVTAYREEEQELSTVALDRHSGKQLWKRVAPKERIESYHETGSPAAATPACDGRRFYVFFGSCGLFCYDLDGNLVWQKSMGPFQDEFGSGSSPILVGDKVILNQDHDADNYLYALDSATGDTVWQTARDEFTRSYATPMLWRAHGTTQIVVPGSLQLVAYDSTTGDRLWWIDGLARIVIPTPAASGDMLIVPSWSPGADGGQRITMEPWEQAAKTWDQDGDGKIREVELAKESPVIPRFFRIDVNQDGGLDEAEWEKHAAVFRRAQNQVLAIRPDGLGELTEAHVAWRFNRGVPYVSSPLIYNDVVFLVKDGGVLTTLDVHSGELLRQGRLRGQGNYYASPVAGDGKIYLASQRGVLTVVTAEGDWKIISSHDFGEAICATPVIDGGRIYLRTDSALYCFAVATQDAK